MAYDNNSDNSNQEAYNKNLELQDFSFEYDGPSNDSYHYLDNLA